MSARRRLLPPARSGLRRPSESAAEMTARVDSKGNSAVDRTRTSFLSARRRLLPPARSGLRRTLTPKATADPCGSAASVRSRGLEPPRVAPLVPETSASAISPRPRREAECTSIAPADQPTGCIACDAGFSAKTTQAEREEPRRPACATRMDRCPEHAPAWRAEAHATSPMRLWSATHPPRSLRHDPADGDRTPWALFRAYSSSSSSPAAAAPAAGPRPLLFAASLAARRFSITRWRISANIAGLSLMNALAFSRPWPMRVPL